MTLKNFALDDGDDQSLKSVSEIGSMLFTRGVSGTRVITGRDEKIFQGNHVFKGKLGSASAISNCHIDLILFQILDVYYQIIINF